MNLNAKLNIIKKRMQNFTIRDSQKELIEKEIASWSTDDLKLIADDETIPSHLVSRLVGAGIELD